MLEDGKTEVYLLGYKKLVQNEGYRSSLLTHHNLKDTKLTDNSRGIISQKRSKYLRSRSKGLCYTRKYKMIDLVQNTSQSGL